MKLFVLMACMAAYAIAQDNCGGVPLLPSIDVGGGAFSESYSITLAPYAGSNVSIPCNSLRIYNGRWVRIQNLPQGGSISVDTCNDNSIDTIVGFYPECGPMNSGPCNDDNCFTGSLVTMESVSTTYVYALIGTYFIGATTGTVAYHVNAATAPVIAPTTAAPPVFTSTGNMLPSCGGRPWIGNINVLGEDFNGDYSVNLADFPASTSSTRCGIWSINNGVWLEIINLAIGSTVTVSSCGTDSIDTIMGFYPACDGSGTGYNCMDDNCAAQTRITTTVTTTSVFVHMGSFAVSQRGYIQYNVNVVSNAHGGTTGTPPIVGPTCGGRPLVQTINMASGAYSQQYSVDLRTFPTLPSMPCSPYSINNGVFIRINNAPLGGTISVYTCGQGNIIDTTIGFFTVCEGITGTNCVDDNCGSGLQSNSTYNVPLSGTGSSTIYAMIGTWSAAAKNIVNFTVVGNYPTVVSTTGVQEIPPDYPTCSGRPFIATIDMENRFYNGTYTVNLAHYPQTTATTGLTCGRWNVQNSVWISLTNLPINSAVSVSTCGGTNIDTIMGWFPACAQDSSSVGYGCVDDNCGLQTRIDTVAMTSTVYVLMGTYSYLYRPTVTYVVTVQPGAAITATTAVAPPAPATTGQQAPSCSGRPIMDSIDVAAASTFSMTRRVDLSSYAPSGSVPCMQRAINNAVWVPLVHLPIGSTLTVTTCQLTTADTMLGIYRTCGSEQAVDCQDDTCNLQTRVAATITDTTMFALIGTWSASARPAINVTFSVSPGTTTGIATTAGAYTTWAQYPMCGNRPIINEVDFSTGVSFVRRANLAQYRQSAAVPCGTYNIYNGVWIRIRNIPPSVTVVVSTCDATAIDSIVGFYETCDGNGVGHRCVDDNCGRQTYATWNATATDYYAMIGTYSMTNTETIVFSVYTIALPPPPPPPPVLTTGVHYETCQNRPIVHRINVNQGQYSVRYEQDITPFAGSGISVACSTYSVRNGFWVAISNIPTGYTVSVSNCEETWSNVDTIFGLYYSCTANGDSCGDDNCGGGFSSRATLYNVRAGATVFAYIGTYAAAATGVIPYRVEVTPPIQTTAIQTTGVQTTGVQTTAVQTTGVQTTGVQTTGVQTTARVVVSGSTSSTAGSPDQGSQSGGSSTAVIAGVVIVGLIALVIAGVFLVLRMRRSRGRNGSRNFSLLSLEEDEPSFDIQAGRD